MKEFLPHPLESSEIIAQRRLNLLALTKTLYPEHLDKVSELGFDAGLAYIRQVIIDTMDEDPGFDEDPDEMLEIFKVIGEVR